MSLDELERIKSQLEKKLIKLEKQVKVTMQDVEKILNAHNNHSLANQIQLVVNDKKRSTEQKLQRVHEIISFWIESVK